MYVTPTFIRPLPDRKLQLAFSTSLNFSLITPIERTGFLSDQHLHDHEHLFWVPDCFIASLTHIIVTLLVFAQELTAFLNNEGAFSSKNVFTISGFCLLLRSALLEYKYLHINQSLKSVSSSRYDYLSFSY